jgi:hypothetical protein
MPSKLKWFTTRLALLGVHSYLAAEAMRDLQNDLEMRPHLRHPSVSWEAETGRMIVQVEIQDLDADQAAIQITEELLESASGVLREFEAIRASVLEAVPSHLNE